MKMFSKVIILIVIILLTCLKIENFASFIPDQKVTSVSIESQVGQNTQAPHVHSTPAYTGLETLRTTTAAQSNQTVISLNPNSQLPTSTTNSLPTTTITTTTLDPNIDPEDLITSISPNNPSSGGTGNLPTPNEDPLFPNKSKPASGLNGTTSATVNTELTVLFYSLFLAYVSFTRLIYHNIGLIKRNITEPGILMIFGILWELVSQQVTTNYNVVPKFNSRVFFYLFLPSTVLESASLLSNKWLFINLLSILVQSIIGTLIYAASMGITIYSLSRQDILNLNPQIPTQPTLPQMKANQSVKTTVTSLIEDNFLTSSEGLDYQVPFSAALEDNPLELKNLTLVDCLVFGTILSSVDSSTMLDVIRALQVNEKLYYLVLGENLMNNAVVLVIFELVLDYFSTTRLTVVKIYVTVITFFTNLVGSVFIGFILAGIALVSVRLTKRFHGSDTPTSYQYQCQAMVETLLILKLAYLTYIVATFAGTSSILSLATFGILQDQYIKHSLNHRSQLSFRQIILATKTMGFSLVYPLLGMLLVELIGYGQFLQSLNPYLDMTNQQQSESAISPSTTRLLDATGVATSKFSHLIDQTSLYWNFKFLSIVTILTIIFRFTVVFFLSSFCNLFSSSQLKIKYKEQVLIAYGGLTGPLAFALVFKLIEHEEYRNRALKNKHLFIYTILFITFISTILKGTFIKPIVYRLKLTFQDRDETRGNFPIVLSEINCKVTELISHGLNSILGHSKSPYDKFSEFNETRIKPWLTWKGSNINWLSEFYDGLILDEILNANCINDSTIVKDSLQTTKEKDRINDVAKIAINVRQFRSNSKGNKFSSLETIDENGVPSRRPEQTSSTLDGHPLRKHIKRNQVSSSDDKSLLKEFVMFNLKLENAKRRYSSRKHSRSKLEPSVDRLGQSNSQRLERMLSTTSSGNSPEYTNGSLELLNNEKRRHLLELEHRLDFSKRDVGTDREYAHSRLESKRRQPLVSRRKRRQVLTRRQNSKSED